MPDEATIAAMTPEQATTALADMAAQYRASQLPSSTAADARLALDRATADAKWSAQLVAGDPRARAQFEQLTQAVAAADEIADAMVEPANGAVFETVVDGQLPRADIAATVGDLRELGLRDEVISEALTARPVSRAEQEACRALLRSRQSDPEWVDRLLKGGYEEKRQMMLMSIVMSAPVL